MKTLILFGSTLGSTFMVVEKLQSFLEFDTDILNVKEARDYQNLLNYELLIIIAPTYGDGELQDDMEEYLFNCPYTLTNKYHAACEIGNYYGYDDFIFGALPIINSSLDNIKTKQLVEPLSMDGLPKKDWFILEKWAKLISTKCNQNG